MDLEIYPVQERRARVGQVLQLLAKQAKRLI